MIGIEFRGWFQCRLASDPDPTDEPRGVSGCTFATVDEPDFDRVIRFRPEGTVPRSFGPKIGVAVSGVRGRSAAAETARRALLGAPVDVGDALFDEENGALVARNTAIIDPFDLRIGPADGAPALRRRALWDPARPDLSPYDVPPARLRNRQPRRLDVKSGAKVARASGGDDPDTLISRRLADLRKAEDAARDAGDATAVAALRQRIEALSLRDWRGDRLRMLLGARGWWGFRLDERAEATELDGRALPGVDASRPWPLVMWMGGWDNDTLCGYVVGRLHLPAADPSP